MVSRRFWNGKRNKIEEFLSSLVGDILEEIDFGQKGRYFIHNKYRKSVGDLGIRQDVPVKLLTPFDNILRERHYPLAIWDFDYKIECYVPAPDRVYGYFVLPILDQNEFRGRVDAKVHRKTSVLELKSLYIEHDELMSDAGIQRLVNGVSEFAKFHGCESIELTTVSPKSFKSKIAAALKS
jgi:uncharacterized protein YcaQ